MSALISSTDKIKEFYEAVGKNYPEEEIVYKSLRGILRRKFVNSWLKDKAGVLMDIGTGEGIYLREYFVRVSSNLPQTCHLDKIL